MSVLHSAKRIRVYEHGFEEGFKFVLKLREASILDGLVSKKVICLLLALEVL
jgi:hypothetical protein